MVAVIFICGTYFCGSLEKSQKLEPAEISCHIVVLVRRFPSASRSIHFGDVFIFTWIT